MLKFCAGIVCVLLIQTVGCDAIVAAASSAVSHAEQGAKRALEYAAANPPPLAQIKRKGERP